MYVNYIFDVAIYYPLPTILSIIIFFELNHFLERSNSRGRKSFISIIFPYRTIPTWVAIFLKMLQIEEFYKPIELPRNL